MPMAIVTARKSEVATFTASIALEEHAAARREQQTLEYWKPVGNDAAERSALGSRRGMVCMSLDEYHKLFTPRQLVALTTFSDLVQEARELATAGCACSAGLANDDVPLREGGVGCACLW